MCKIICTKCLQVRPASRHHCFPKRFFGGEGPLLWLCRKCHNDIERIIPQFQKLTKEDYLTLTREFLLEA